jgi:hypothetical protein
VRDDFAIFIISHERADRVESYDMLRKAGYTGKICIVVDDEDSQLSEYKEKFIGLGDDYVIYNKDVYRASTEVCRRVEGCATYARNAVEYFAKAKGLKAFMVADDDLLRLRFRHDEKGVLKSTPVTSGLNEILESYIDFILESNIACVSFGTANAYMNGIKPESVSNNRLPFNCFIRNAEYTWTWKAEIYEDAVTSILESWNGDFAMQLPFIQCDMCPMDAGAKGGMTDVYSAISQYEKNFPVLIYAPSCVKLGLGKRSFIYTVQKKNAFPKLISGKYKKVVEK